MSYELIKVDDGLFDGQVTKITLGPPPANIISAALMDELSSQLEKSNNAKHTKLIVIEGEGKHFSFGASVEEHKSDQVGGMLPAFHDMIGRVIDSAVPTLATVGGMCLGGGFELAIACSMIFCEEGAGLGTPVSESLPCSSPGLLEGT